MRMNSALGKSILALVRDGDYAHAGEEEAIRLALASFPREAGQRILDAGCGRGGTARFVQDIGWGKVSGFDIEGTSIARAQSLHPDLTLETCDVLDVARHFAPGFDLIYSFNAVYAFPDQPAALLALRSVARAGASLVIFDYINHGGFASSDLARLEESAHWQPLQFGAFTQLLSQTGWQHDTILPLDAEYERWYIALLQRIEARREAIIALAGGAAYDHTHLIYQSLLQAIQKKAIGGAIFYAHAV